MDKMEERKDRMKERKCIGNEERIEGQICELRTEEMRNGKGKERRNKR